MGDKLKSASARVDTDSAALETSVSTLIKQVGARVLVARKAKRFSRRELSERSGVSTRYLVQLESGEGNISIGLLHRVASALELTIDKLVSDDDALDDELNDEVARVILRYRRADAATRAHVQRVLDPAGMREQKAERVCLIGLRGAGKSTLGSRLSQSLQVPFIELNSEIERNVGMPISEIIALYGEEGYRALEADSLTTIIASHERLILAVAGGLVEQPDTFAEVLGRCHTIWLKADPTEHMARVRAQGDLRPMAGNPQAMTQLRQILLTRESDYRQAECHLNTSGRTVDESLEELRELIASHNMIASDGV